MKKWGKSSVLPFSVSSPASLQLFLCLCVCLSLSLTHIHRKKKAVLARGRMKDVKSAFLSLLGSLLAKIALIFIAITQSRY